MTRRRLLPTLVAVALVSAVGALVYGWLVGLPPGPTVAYGQFLRNVGAGQVATVVDRDGTFTVVDTHGFTYRVVGAGPPGVTATWLSVILDVAAGGGHPFDPANYREEKAPDTAWISAYVLAVALFVLAAGYIFFMTGPEPRASPTRDIRAR